jgi:hypothetical protein
MIQKNYYYLKKKKRGFKFVGSTVVYAYLQATGLINDHVSDCLKKSVNNGVVFSDFSKLYTYK